MVHMSLDVMWQDERRRELLNIILIIYLSLSNGSHRQLEDFPSSTASRLSVSHNEAIDLFKTVQGRSSAVYLCSGIAPLYHLNAVSFSDKSVFFMQAFRLFYGTVKMLSFLWFSFAVFYWLLHSLFYPQIISLRSSIFDTRLYTCSFYLYLSNEILYTQRVYTHT